MNSYTPEEQARHRYYLTELRDLYIKFPKSLCLRNGIAELESRLCLEPTVERICSNAFISAATSLTL